MLVGKCTLYKQDTKNSSVYDITTFLCIILILHPGHTSLFLETVTIKFMGPRAEGRHIESRAEAQEKQISSLNTMILLEKEKVVN